MSILSIIKKLVPEAIKKPLRRLLTPYLLRRSWMVRKSQKGDDQISMYWNAEKQPNRLKLIDILIQEFEYLGGSVNATPAILEYGSHVGLNLRMLNELLPSNLKTLIFAVEPNAEAVNFLRQKLPYVQVLQAEDSIFCGQNSFPPQGRYLTFINSVFYSMEQRRTKAVLARLCAISESVVLGESIVNIDGRKSCLRDNPACFDHPYRRWLDEFGFEIVTVDAAPDPRPQLNGFIVARRRQNNSHAVL